MRNSYVSVIKLYYRPSLIVTMLMVCFFHVSTSNVTGRERYSSLSNKKKSIFKVIHVIFI